ncbi:DUF6194 family protein [Actinokineospora sp. HUAS TT18]|uniref:DUF6194 family protein n=1 Tax=Actinokineospora sp. HUAS TT18 TaxID=3447451 RepID=UPI003F5276BA
MNIQDWADHITTTYDGINVLHNGDDLFFLYDPDRDLPPERQNPFVTIVTGNSYDTVSDLSEPGAYRLNIGLTKATYTSMFGAVPTVRDENGILDTGVDPALRDQLMPHPVYASQHWVSVITPESTLDAVRELVAEAYEFAARKHGNRAKRA